MCKPVTLTPNSREIAIEVSAEPEDLPVAGNVPDSDVASILRRLKRGNAWAWCQVRVRVTYRGVLSSDSVLGSCSYKSEKHFRNDNGFYLQLVNECIDELNKRLVLLCGPGKDDTAS